MGSSVKKKSAKRLLALRVAVQWMRNKRRAHDWPPSKRDQRKSTMLDILTSSTTRHGNSEVEGAQDTISEKHRTRVSQCQAWDERRAAPRGKNTHALRGAKVRAQYRWLHAASGIQK